MSFDFNMSDILDIAIEIERNGAEFYRSAGERVTQPESRQLLLNLASIEEQHENKFSNMKADLTEEEKNSNIFDPYNETSNYLKALADLRIFYKKEIPGDTLEEILKSGIDAEKDSIVFYLGMKEFVPEKHGKTHIDDIIKEEMGHLRLLSNQLSGIKK